MSSAAPDEPTANFLRTKIVGDLIRKTRDELGLSRPDVTKLTGLSDSVLYLIETGERQSRAASGAVIPYAAKAATLVKLARALGITPTQFENAGRPDVAVELLTAHLAAGKLDDVTTRQLVAGLRKLRDSVPGFAALVEWVGIATGQLPPPTPRQDDDSA